MRPKSGNPNNGNGTFDVAFFGHDNYNRCERFIRYLTFNNLFVEDRVKTRVELAKEGLLLTPAGWMRLQLAAISIRTRLRKLDETDQIICNLPDFLDSVKKGLKNSGKFCATRKLNQLTQTR